MENETIITLDDLQKDLESKQTRVLELGTKEKLTTKERLELRFLNKEIEELEREINFRESFHETNLNNSNSDEYASQRITELRKKLSRNGNLKDDEWEELANLQTNSKYKQFLNNPSRRRITPDLDEELKKMENEMSKLKEKGEAITSDEEARIDELSDLISKCKTKIHERDLIDILNKQNPTIDEKQALFNNIIETQIKFNEQLTDDLKETLGLEDISPEVLNAKLDELNSSIATLRKYAKGRKVAKEISAMEEQIEAIKYFQENYTDLDALKDNIQEDFRRLYGQKISEKQKDTLLQRIIQIAELYNSRLRDKLKKKLLSSVVDLKTLKNNLERYQSQLEELKNNNPDQHNQEIEDLKDKIESIKQSIETYKSNYIDIENLKNQFAKLYNQNASIEQKANFLSSILDPCNIFNNKLFDELEQITGLSFDSYDDVINTKDKLSATLEELEKNNSDGKNDPYIKDLKKKIEKIKSFKTWYINIDTDKIQYDFLESFNSKTSEAEKEVIRNNMATLLSNDSINFELNNQEDSKKKKKKREKLKKETKRKLKQKDDEVKRSKKPLIIIGALALVTAITITTISQWQSITDFFGFNKNNDDNDKDKCPSSSMAEETKVEIDDALKEKVILDIKNNIGNCFNRGMTAKIASETPETITRNKLIKIGYERNSAKSMAENFIAEEIDKILDQEYDNRIELYANESEFLLHNLQDYEDARSKFNLTPSETVDYVNRAGLIWATHFYEEAEVLDITEIVASIDNRDTFTREHANLAQSFNTSFNRIIDNYLTGAVTSKDIQKMGGIKYFAKEGTDMYNFLEEFEFLSIKCLQNDPDAKAKMYDYINIFATSLNGFTNEKNALTDDAEFNKKAQVNDYFDWYIIYDLFIKPLYPAFSDEASFAKFEELQILMETALQGPEFQAICGQSRTLEVN